METLSILDKSKRQRVPVKDILCLEGNGNYTIIHIQGRKPILVSLTLKHWEDKLPGFLRIHKMSLINPRHLINFSATHIVLSNGSLWAMSRRKARVFRSQLNQYLPSLEHSPNAH
ncbi:LytR/AlgR family response regulator transcription factor [Spirosoma sp.]|uniref:LytR/AlgR family response regulator transcription factor n=1 Tax=Spirosoma sp. TaxID=1899569 RepID=UPI003B3AAA59